MIHLFFLASPLEGGDPAECPASAGEDCLQRFGSAIEVEGSDGALFEVQEGARLEVPMFPGQRCSDPDVFQLADGRWGMYINELEHTALYVSDELHGTYEPMETLGMPPFFTQMDHGLGVGYYHPENEEYWTYINYPEGVLTGEEVNIVIQRAVHQDFDDVIQPEAFDTVIHGGDGSGLPEKYWAASPGFTVNRP